MYLIKLWDVDKQMTSLLSSAVVYYILCDGKITRLSRTFGLDHWNLTAVIIVNLSTLSECLRPLNHVGFSNAVILGGHV